MNVCAICGHACHRRPTRWVMSLLAGAKAHGLTVKEPTETRVHDRCRDALQVLIERRRRVAAQTTNEVSQ